MNTFRPGSPTDLDTFGTMDLIERTKKLAIIARFSDDDLMQRLVLKGGNALDLVYALSTRASADLDFSIEGEFESLEVWRAKIERVLVTTFAEHGFVVFDVRFAQVPPTLPTT